MNPAANCFKISTSTKESFIDGLFNLVETASITSKIGWMKSFEKLPLSTWKRAIPLVGEGLFDIHDPETPIYMTDIKPIDVDYKWDITIIRESNQSEVHGGGYQLLRDRRIHMPEVRGKLKKVFPIMNETLVCDFINKGQYLTGSMYSGFNGKKWSYLEKNQGFIRPTAKEEIGSEYGQDRMGIMLCLEAYKRYQWYAEIQSSISGLSIMFATTPDSSKELFKLRDIPDNKRRREMIKNWVTDHWRYKKSTDDKSIHVIQHMRGVKCFNWMDYRVTIHPSEYDLEQLKKYKDEK